MSAAAPEALARAARGTLLSSFAGDHAPDWMLRQAAAGLGGVCLYRSNRGADVATVAAALHDARPEVVVALDEEGGDVTRVEAATGSSVPGNAALGAVDDLGLTWRVAAALGGVLHAAGVDLDLAPCADVNSDRANPVIGVRSFGADPGVVARHTAAFVGGLRSAGVAACAKHFPGHGAVTVDSHVSLPTVAAPVGVLRARELAPFRAAIRAGVAAVMPGHLLVPALDAVPATVSRPIVTDLLRGELGFDGLVVTDALDMGGIGGPEAIPATVVRALAAGADLCCLGPDNDEAVVEACVEAVVAAIAAGELAPGRVTGAAARVAALRSNLRGGRVERPASPPRRGVDVPAEVAPRHGVDVTAEAAPRHGVGGVPEVAPPHGVGRVARRPPSSDAELAAPARAALAAIGAEAAGRAVVVAGDPPVPIVGAHVVELDRPANVAAGSVPWGVAAALAALDPATTTARIAEGDDPAVRATLVAARGRPLVVVVRDPQRRPAQMAALRTLLAARPDAVAVDMGWPVAPEQRPDAAAWITSHGASRASGEVVARLLAGVLDRPPPTIPTAATRGGSARG
ncbi:MAG TPA: glycoside hydrolase family 3 N-terminal domain-containing protein [Acidimicrobiales bacterium]|nr:glycoside hydrolase family 3 N-terminal domain-containing protein [Acidimicrobiales bacterium]